jgi:aryl-alcohol dehydrogenase-like predicted oxidoreductase
MRYRRLGKAGFEVSELGYGAWGIGKSQWLGAQDDESLKALNHAIDEGLTFIDTALAYGRGHSEQLIGRVVRERSETVRVASKVPPKNQRWPAPDDATADEAFPGEWVRRCTERSLRNLALERIDVQQFHVWNDRWVGQGDWLDAIEELKAEGKIGAFGVSINDHQPANALALIETGVVDSVQVIYNVFDQSPEDELLAACKRHDVGVIVRVPFDEGALTGTITPDTEFPEGDFREHYFRDGRRQEVFDRTEAIASELGIERDQLAEIALRYVLSHDAVSTVIPGMRSVRNVQRNLAAAGRGPLEPGQLQALKAHRWERNFYV